MIASRKADRLQSAVTEIRGNLPQCNIDWVECNIRKEESVSRITIVTLLSVKVQCTS